MAWSTLTQTTLEVGLGMQSFMEHARLLKLQCAMQIVGNQPTAWVLMVGELISREMRRGSHKYERHNWRPSKALLLNIKLYTTSKTINSILSNWQGVIGNLSFANELYKLPGHLSIQQLLAHEQRRGFT